MKKFYKHIILFILPFLIFSAFILFTPYDKKFAYKKITGECSVEFAYHRIFEDTTSLEVAFIGSSKTYTGVNDLLINFLFKNQYKRDEKVANIAFCGTGRNIHYAFIKELFSYKKPEILVIEVRENETNNGHISFGVVADAQDIVLQRFKGFSSYSTDLFNGMKSRYDYIFQGKADTNKYVGPNHGFVANYKMADTVYLNYFKNRKLKGKEKFYQPIHNSKYSLYFLNKIVKLADENHCKIYFLYLPSFGFIENSIELKDYYTRHGELLIPPSKLFDNVKYWTDQNHMNRAGADSTSCWIAEELNKRLKNK